MPLGDTFYSYVVCLECDGIIGGYPDGTFRPDNNITRGQLAKIVSNSVGFSDDPGAQIFEDVPPGSTYFVFINRLARRGIMTGYTCPLVNGVDMGCVPGDHAAPEGTPYFRPEANATRGQMAKIVAGAAGYEDAPKGQTFADVPETSPFYAWIERLATRGIIQGYACGTTSDEPCDVANRPYFRWAGNETRGQAAKIVTGTFFPLTAP